MSLRAVNCGLRPQAGCASGWSARRRDAGSRRKCTAFDATRCRRRHWGRRALTETAASADGDEGESESVVIVSGVAYDSYASGRSPAAATITAEAVGAEGVDGAARQLAEDKVRAIGLYYPRGVSVTRAPCQRPH